MTLRPGVVLLLGLVGCGAPAAHAKQAETPPPVPVERSHPPVALASLLSHVPDLVLTVHPPLLTRDPVYGPLLRRASELAAAYAGPTNLGTTALAVLEKTDEVVVAENDRGKEAVVVLRGVPAEIDPLDVVDTAGRPVWRVVHGDARTASRELEPVEPSDAALFVAPGLVWVIASGRAVSSTRAAIVGGIGRDAFAGDDTALLSLSLPGDALPQLRKGTLATVGAGLLHIRLELTPGKTGLVVGKLEYADTVSAASAEGTVLAVTLAFRHRLEEAVEAAGAGKGRAVKPTRDPEGTSRPASNLDWLGAAKVEREGTIVVVRAPIPRPWLDALTHADVAAPAP